MDIILSKNSFSYLENQCAICMDFFHSVDIVSLVIHKFNGQSEKQSGAVKRLHIFHSECFKGITNKRCPLDNCDIHKVRDFKYSHIIALNIVNYSCNYLDLIKEMPPAISVTDTDNLNHPDYNGKTLLYCSCQCNETKLINKLLNCGADFNIPDSNGFVPLMVLCSSNFHETLVGVLRKQNILKSININSEDIYGFTAMDYAIRHNSWQCVQILLEKFFNKINESGKARLLEYVTLPTKNKEQNDLKTLIKYYFPVKIRHQPEINHEALVNEEENDENENKRRQIIRKNPLPISIPIGINQQEINFNGTGKMEWNGEWNEIEKMKCTDLYLKRPKIIKGRLYSHAN